MNMMRNILEKYIVEKHGADLKKYTILGMRGMTLENGFIKGNQNKNDEWNDAIVIIGNGKFLPHIGTVDPGNYWLQNPMNKNGTARLEPGDFIVTEGLHRGKRALVQYSEVTVRRDGNKDKKFDNLDKVYKGKFAINVHFSSDLSVVGTDSAGCIVFRYLWGSNEAELILDLLYGSKQKFFQTIITDEQNLGLFIGDMK
jgi:hypothetical protein